MPENMQKTFETCCLFFVHISSTEISRSPYQNAHQNKFGPLLVFIGIALLISSWWQMTASSSHNALCASVACVRTTNTQQPVRSYRDEPQYVDRIAEVQAKLLFECNSKNRQLEDDNKQLVAKLKKLMQEKENWLANNAND